MNLPQETLSEVKKRAMSEGISESKIACKLIEIGLATQPGSGVEAETIRKVVGELLEPLAVRLKIAVPEWKVTLADMDLPGMDGFSGSESGSGIPPEIVRYLVETLGRFHFFMKTIHPHLSHIPGVTEGELKDWLVVVPKEAEEVLKTLKIENKK